MNDIQQYLESKNIEVFTKGNNVTSGWLNIRCPFSGCFDHSNHLGIDLKSNFFNCHLCSEKGHITKLIKEIEGCSWTKAKNIARNFSDYDYEIEDDFKPLDTSIIPKEASDIFPQKHIDYLLSRNFNANYLIKKYKLRACHTTGKYRFRIIAPIFIDRIIVSFVAIDVTDEAESKYKLCPNKDAIYPKRKIIYNIDSVKDKIIISEGVNESWAFGDGTCAIFGKKLTKDQINLLLEKEIARVTILLDPEAINEGEEIAEQLSGIINDVRLVEISDCDPDELEIDDINEIKKIAFD